MPCPTRKQLPRCDTRVRVSSCRPEQSLKRSLITFSVPPPFPPSPLPSNAGRFSFEIRPPSHTPPGSALLQPHNGHPRVTALPPNSTAPAALTATGGPATAAAWKKTMVMCQATAVPPAKDSGSGGGLGSGTNDAVRLAAFLTDLKSGKCPGMPRRCSACAGRQEVEVEKKRKAQEVSSEHWNERWTLSIERWALGTGH